jgi:hypothetical protein
VVSERREVVVGSVLQAHQLRQQLRSLPDVRWSEGDRESRDGVSAWVFVITADQPEWVDINQWLQRIGAQS